MSVERVATAIPEAVNVIWLLAEVVSVLGTLPAQGTCHTPHQYQGFIHHWDTLLPSKSSIHPHRSSHNHNFDYSTSTMYFLFLLGSIDLYNSVLLTILCYAFSD